MTDVDSVESKLARAAEADEAEARRLLTEAREGIARLRERGDADADRLDALETDVEQRLRAVGERDAYDGGGVEGAATNPDDEDAP
ncbi:hypothetical protein [Halostella litorea]|uniref:hypothetical protein n=1 Tax=Halostella litorea TaxID=2528831 RepID=UPI00109221A6|nr:hypothetical protein [Halostella litorea]